jgi:AbrB family looped-hinge helix DNA binding protein
VDGWYKLEGEDWSPTFTAMVEKNYRVVIPSVIRKLLNLKEYDVLEVKVKRVRSGKILRG